MSSLESHSELNELTQSSADSKRNLKYKSIASNQEMLTHTKESGVWNDQRIRKRLNNILRKDSLKVVTMLSLALANLHKSSRFKDTGQ